VVHGRKLGRELGFRTLNLRFSHWKPAASGIFVVRCMAWPNPAGVANLGVRPRWTRTTSTAGVLLETHCLDWPARWVPRGLR
jgi:riboflavin kinase/FMN adenylyltransferase